MGKSSMVRAVDCRLAESNNNFDERATMGAIHGEDGEWYQDECGMWYQYKNGAWCPDLDRTRDQEGDGEDSIVERQRKARTGAIWSRADKSCPHCGSSYEEDELFCRMCGIKREGMQADFQRASVMVAVEKEQEIRRQGLQDNNPDAVKDLMVLNYRKLLWKASHKAEECCPHCGNAYKADEVFCPVCGTERTGTEAGFNDEALQPAVEKDTYEASRDGKEKAGRSKPRAKVQAKVQSKAQARAGARRAPTAEALRNMMLDSDMRDGTIEVAPPQAIQMIAEAKVRSNPHRARTKKGYTTEVAPPQSGAKVRFTPHRARTKEDDTTEAEAGAQARAVGKTARSAARRAPPSQQALQSMELDSEMRDKNIEVAPPPAIQRIAEAKPRFNPHRGRTKEDDTTEAEPRVRPATKKRRAPP